MPERPEDPNIARLERRYEERPGSLVFARLADAYRKEGRLDRALEVVERGLERHPDYLSARVVRARVLQESGRTESAVRAFEGVLDVDPFNLVSLRALADLAEARSDAQAVRRWTRRLLEADPYDEAARARLAAAGEDPDVVEAPARGGPVATGGGSGAGEAVGRPEPLTVTMAELYMAQGLHSEAARIYDRLLEGGSRHPDLEEKLEDALALSETSVPEGDRESGPEAGPATADDRSVAGSRPDPPPPGTGIRAWLRALLDGTARDFDPARPHPTAMEAWLERSGA